MIRVDALVKRYPALPEPALRRVSFEVASGKLVAILGKSGAGKSTLLRCLVGLERFDEGTVEVDGVAVRAEDGPRGLRVLHGRVGLVPQSLDLFPHLSALDNCTLAPRIVKGERRADAEARASRLLGRLGLEAEQGAYPEHLSGGQRQRVAIARALAMEPRVLLYDEPTSSLDPSLREEVGRTLLTVKESGVTQLVSTHDWEFARSAAEWVLVLEGGAIVREGEPGQIVG